MYENFATLMKWYGYGRSLIMIFNVPITVPIVEYLVVYSTLRILQITDVDEALRRRRLRDALRFLHGLRRHDADLHDARRYDRPLVVVGYVYPILAMIGMLVSPVSNFLAAAGARRNLRLREVEDLPGLAPLGGSDDAALLHLLDQPRRAVVADLQTSLDVRG